MTKLNYNTSPSAALQAIEKAEGPFKVRTVFADGGIFDNQMDKELAVPMLTWEIQHGSSTLVYGADDKFQHTPLALHLVLVNGETVRVQFA